MSVKQKEFSEAKEPYLDYGESLIEQVRTKREMIISRITGHPAILTGSANHTFSPVHVQWLE